MMHKQEKTVDLRNVGENKTNGGPLITKYKGKKTVGLESIQTQKIYGFNNLKEDGKNKK